jgi:flavin reductase (DIM6/NTAB) family NADH-FMN oxidoreductase RutF
MPRRSPRTTPLVELVCFKRPDSEANPRTSSSDRRDAQTRSMLVADRISGKHHREASSQERFSRQPMRRYLEPGPIVLVSSKLGHKTNIMRLGWHTILEFSPSLVGLMVSSGNHSFHMIRESQQCVINLPTTALTDTVVRIGNTSGRQIDKFAEFGLTAEEASVVDAPLIRECHARFECQLHEDALVDRYNFFSSRWSRLTWQPRRNTRKRCTSPATEHSWCPERSSAGGRCSDRRCLVSGPSL